MVILKPWKTWSFECSGVKPSKLGNTGQYNLGQTRSNWIYFVEKIEKWLPRLRNPLRLHNPSS